MGNEHQASRPVDLKNFPMQKYLNQGLKQQEIIKIKEAFDSYQPINGEIQVSKLFQATEQSGSHDQIHSNLKGKNTLNFDEFFQFSRQLIEEQIKKNPALIIDASEVQASCLFCPYTSDIPKSTAWYLHT